MRDSYSANSLNRVRNIFALLFYQAKVVNFLLELHENPKIHRNGTLILKPAEDLRLVSFWVLCDILYGAISPEIEAQLLEIVEIREKAGFNRQAADRARSLFDGLLPICDFFSAVDSGKLSKHKILDTIDEILFANLDVTIGSLSWVLVFLATYTNVQTDLRREIVENKSRASPAGTKSPVGLSGGLFNPRRFLQAKNPSEFRYRLWRFGFGPRQCLGKYLADLFLKTLLSYILENYSIQMKDSS
ncbi:uncharacterized protein N7473_004250 [Penicillium subrubescens]|uniref:uncharacterized protein n=1 Tax=Penicillium subrubescens TaxID=1316194 RepID=UPI002545BB3B|nr:uncharacterized protein N7473_004250 [Penicillium subrubescens]KAJ5900180.1 hypothetical protein N7473_004250 [Penicillium subrubescens]